MNRIALGLLLSTTLLGSAPANVRWGGSSPVGDHYFEKR